MSIKSCNKQYKLIRLLTAALLRLEESGRASGRLTVWPRDSQKHMDGGAGHDAGGNLVGWVEDGLAGVPLHITNQDFADRHGPLRCLEEAHRLSLRSVAVTLLCDLNIPTQ